MFACIFLGAFIARPFEFCDNLISIRNYQLSYRRWSCYKPIVFSHYFSDWPSSCFFLLLDGPPWTAPLPYGDAVERKRHFIWGRYIGDVDKRERRVHGLTTLSMNEKLEQSFDYQRWGRSTADSVWRRVITPTVPLYQTLPCDDVWFLLRSCCIRIVEIEDFEERMWMTTISYVDGRTSGSSGVRRSGI